MRCVLDSSVAVKTVLVEVDSDKASLLLDERGLGLHDFLAPDIFHVELAHALTRAERQSRITPAESWSGWQAIMADSPLLVESLPLMTRAYDISSSMRVGIYDCLYVALAELEGCELLTADDKLVRNLQSTFPFVISLSSMP